MVCDSEGNLVCRTCNKRFSLDEEIWRCGCGGLLDIDFGCAFPIDKIEQRKQTMWRYREAIPVREDKNVVSFDEGFTPMLKVEMHGRPVLIKQDQLFPSGSFKDRGASVLISKIKELRIKRVVEDSSGNAGSAIAAYCAKAGIECEVFVPSDTAAGKLTQIRCYGAKLRKVTGSREDTAQAVLQAAKRDYYASHYWNPFFFQGTKTLAYEICEQLGWQAPQVVVLPVGNGTLILGAYIGFSDLLKCGVIEQIPRIIAVQSVNCAPLGQAFVQGRKDVLKVDKKNTIAKGISIAEPIRGAQVLSAVRESNGDFITVSDAEIIATLKTMSHKGFYIEPTAAAAIAGLDKYVAKSPPDELIVSLFTGSGLKTVSKIADLFN